MNQVLLETIVEKLEGLEISLLKENKTGNDGNNSNRFTERNKIISIRNGKTSFSFKTKQ
ncbi:MAG: hypothetical protein WKF59_20360 [Chitinophagaceae bacterium]